MQGGAKLLVTGAFRRADLAEGSSYQLVFDGVAVPAVLVQDGVLKCHVPGRATLILLALLIFIYVFIYLLSKLAHEAGSCRLEVALSGRVVGQAVDFEFRAPEQQQQQHLERLAAEILLDQPLADCQVIGSFTLSV